LFPREEHYRHIAAGVTLGLPAFDNANIIHEKAFVKYFNNKNSIFYFDTLVHRR
jgi:hypothetical protein